MRATIAKPPMSERDAIEPRARLSERDRRKAANEALFRQVNERLEGLNETLGVVAGTFSVVCECDDEGCVEQIELPREVYEAARAHPDVFILRPGHATPKVEVVIEDHEGWQLVQKRPGAPADFAEKTSPR